ncbi:MAG TPA: carboxymuconolactone decarboxylase family protein [Jiangellaceae bacterium]|nr:carboxymuconolactone decarboxylase family protein [Jiangellaceae bacterium]
MVTHQDRVHRERLRSLAVNDHDFIESVLAIRLENVESSGLDPKTHALVRLGALLALDAAPASYQWVVGAAFASGATLEEIVGVLIAVAPTVGVARVVSAAPELALAVGYDIDKALERLDDEGNQL